MSDPVISLYNNIGHTKKGLSITLSTFLERVKEGYWQDDVLKYRNNKTPENKKALPYATISGLFEERKAEKITTHSGYIAIDIDGLKNLNDIREQICCDPKFYAVFVSCGGSGLCAISHINPKTHLESFNYLSKYLYEKYGIIEVDEACKDVSRARFVSYDPDLWINKEAEYVNIKPYTKKEKPEATHYVFVQSEFTETINRIIESKIDITDNYGDWIKVGFALAGKFGESGRDYFHALSEMNAKYDRVKCDQKYTHLMRTNKEVVPIDYIYNLAKIQKVEVQAIDEDNIINQIEGYIKSTYKLRRNLVSRNIEMDGKPLTDIDINSIFTNTKRRLKTATKEVVRSVIFSDFVESYNPFHEFLKDHLKIKPNGNIDKLIQSITTDTPNHDMFIRKWLTSLMASINGKHSPLVLVLIGGQNTGKTEWFRRLLPQELKTYYAEDKLEQVKDSDILMTKKLIIMDDEMGGKSKAESKTLNRLTSSQTFSIREPYGTVHVDLQRLALLCGTTNYEGILNDPTGNRRILPVRVLSINYELYNSIDKRLLFYEIYHLYNGGFNYNLTSDEISLLNDSTGEFKAVSIEEDMILQYFRVPEPGEPCDYLTSTQILSYIKINAQVTLSPVIIGLRMKYAGFSRTMKKVNGNPLYRWEVVTINNLTTNPTTSFLPPERF